MDAARSAWGVDARTAFPGVPDARDLSWGGGGVRVGRGSGLFYSLVAGRVGEFVALTGRDAARMENSRDKVCFALKVFRCVRCVYCVCCVLALAQEGLLRRAHCKRRFCTSPSVFDGVHFPIFTLHSLVGGTTAVELLLYP